MSNVEPDGMTINEDGDGEEYSGMPEEQMMDTSQEKVEETVISDLLIENVNNLPSMTITEKVVEVIGDSICATLRVRRYVAAEIIKLLEAEDKSLALIASDADIPLWVAMQCADYGKKAAMAMVNKVGEEYIENLKLAGQTLKGLETSCQSVENMAKDRIDVVKEFMRRLNE